MLRTAANISGKAPKAHFIHHKVFGHFRSCVSDVSAYSIQLMLSAFSSETICGLSSIVGHYLHLVRFHNERATECNWRTRWTDAAACTRWHMVGNRCTKLNNNEPLFPLLYPGTRIPLGRRKYSISSPRDSKSRNPFLYY